MRKFLAVCVLVVGFVLAGFILVLSDPQSAPATAALVFCLAVIAAACVWKPDLLEKSPEIIDVEVQDWGTPDPELDIPAYLRRGTRPQRLTPVEARQYDLRV